MDETHGDTPNQYTEAAQSKRRRTGSQEMPALRLGRRITFNRAQQQQRNAATGVSTATITADTSAPPLLRLLRFVVGVVLLGLAWIGILAVVMLAQLITQPATRAHIITHLLFDVAVASAACLIGITVLGCLITGAFCLTLALTSRDWQ